MDINLINYSAGPFSANTDLWDKTDKSADFQINVVARLRYTPKEDVCGFQFDIMIDYKNEFLLKCGFLFGLRIKDLATYIDDSLTKEQNTKSVEVISSFIWPFVVGAFAARCADQKIDMILPRINYEKFAEEVMLIKSEQ